MAKLIVLSLALAALVAFASAHNTIVTTTIIEQEDPSSRQQCSRQIQGQRFNQCQRYLQPSQSLLPWFPGSGQQGGDVQSCCRELQRVDEQCQCEAVQEAFRQAQRQQQQGWQGIIFGSSQVQQMRQKAQNLPDQCGFQTRQCRIGTISVTTTTTTPEDNAYGSQQQCQNIRGRQFNQCQNFIQRQITGSSGTQMISTYGQQGIQQCCNELENVERDCQCDAMQEVYRQAQQQLPQWSQQGQGGSRRGQPQMQDLQQIFQNLRNQCNLQVQQCRIPSAMF